jgi:TIR domain
MKKPVAFMSYARRDNDDAYLTKLRERLSSEVGKRRGEDVDIFLDEISILLGQNWEKQIEESIDQALLFIPIISPRFFKSKHCRSELERFRAREQKLDRDDLILPIYYVDADVLNDEEERKNDQLAQAIHARQYADWRELRGEPWRYQKVKGALRELAIRIHYALKRVQEDLDLVQAHRERDDLRAKAGECLDLLYTIQEANTRVLGRIEAQNGEMWQHLATDDYNRVCKTCVEVAQQRIDSDPYLATVCSDPDVSAVCEHKWYLGERLAEYEKVFDRDLSELHDVTEPPLSPQQLGQAITAAVRKVNVVLNGS